MSRNRNLVGVAAFAALVVISGCGQVPPATQPELNDATPNQVVEAELHDAVDCRSEPSSWTPNSEDSIVGQPIAVPGRVPTGFDAIAAVRCTLEFDLAPVGGPAGDVFWRVERFEGELNELLDALAEPDDAPPSGEMLCTADMEFVPALWLEVRTGGFAPVHHPRNACGKTKPAVENALDRLQVATVERIEIER